MRAALTVVLIVGVLTAVGGSTYGLTHDLTVVRTPSQNRKPLDLGFDLKGGSYVLIEGKSGKLIWTGKPLTCAQMKHDAPFLFKRLKGKPPMMTDDCQLSRTGTTPGFCGIDVTPSGEIHIGRDIIPSNQLDILGDRLMSFGKVHQMTTIYVQRGVSEETLARVRRQYRIHHLPYRTMASSDPFASARPCNSNQDTPN